MIIYIFRLIHPSGDLEFYQACCSEVEVAKFKAFFDKRGYKCELIKTVEVDI